MGRTMLIYIVPDEVRKEDNTMKVKRVRRDVIIKLMIGYRDAVVYAQQHKASIPKSYKYRTTRCDHYVYHDTETNKYYFNTVQYDGNRCHTTLDYKQLQQLLIDEF